MHEDSAIACGESTMIIGDDNSSGCREEHRQVDTLKKSANPSDLLSHARQGHLAIARFAWNHKRDNWRGLQTG
ncbi:MAG: hypothetical protein Tsb009_10760 [Planctomycetaceae bacterium]